MARLAEDVRPALAASAERGSSWCGPVAAFVSAPRLASRQLHKYGGDKPERRGHQSGWHRYHDSHGFAKRRNKYRAGPRHFTYERGAAIFLGPGGGGCRGTGHCRRSAGSGLVWNVDGPDLADGKSRDVENDSFCSSHSLVCYRVLFKRGDGTSYGTSCFQVIRNSAGRVVGLVVAVECGAEHDPGSGQGRRFHRVVAKKTSFILSRSGSEGHRRTWLRDAATVADSGASPTSDSISTLIKRQGHGCFT